MRKNRDPRACPATLVEALAEAPASGQSISPALLVQRVARLALRSPLAPAMFLHVLMKRTRRYDLESAVLTCIAESMGAEAAGSAGVRSAARALAEKRDAAALTTLLDRPNHGGANVATLDSTLRYINAVQRIAASGAGDMCLPSGTTRGVAEFEWSDSFSQASTKTSQYKLDMVACTVNCGAITATIAARQAHAALLGEGELLEAARFYQRAAGFYGYCADSMPYQIAGGTVDLHAPTHTVLKYAMLANAQQLLYQSAMKPENRIPGSAKARIAAGARSLYAVAASHCAAAALRDTSTARHVGAVADVLSLYFGAEADLGDAAVAEARAMEADPGQWGVHMARVRRARGALERARARCGALPAGSDEAASIPGKVGALLELAAAKLGSAVERNRDFQELEPAALPDVEPQILAKPMDVAGLFAAGAADAAIEPLVALCG